MAISSTSAAPRRRNKMRTKVGFGYDIHRLKEGEGNFLLAGQAIDANYAIVAHSDGDIVFHSLSDAILSALGLDDIGSYFPDDQESTCGMDSKEILSFALKKLEEASYRMNNAAIDIVLQSVKLKNYRASIKENLCQILSLPKEDVSVHFHTKEGLDSVGNNQGIEVYTAVTITELGR